MDTESSKRISLLLERLVKQFFNGAAPEKVKNYALKIASSRIAVPRLRENEIKEESLAGLSEDQSEKFKKLFLRLIRLKAVSRRAQILYILSKLKNFDVGTTSKFENIQISNPNKGSALLNPLPVKWEKMILMEKEIISDILLILAEKIPVFFEKDKNDDYVLEKARILQPYQQMTLEVLELFYLHQKVKKFVNSQHLSKTEELVSEFYVKELENYQLFVKSLQDIEMINMRKVHFWIKEPIEKMKLLLILVDSIEGLKGSQILSVVYNLSSQGNVQIRSLMQEILQHSSTKISEMIESWCHYGLIIDVFNEFFISEDLQSDINSLWTKKYQITQDLVPCFFPESLVLTLFKTGKTINFIKSACSEPYSSTLLSCPPLTSTLSLRTWAESQLTQAGSFLISLIKIKYNLDSHFSCLKKYLLLAQADFSQSLISRLIDLLGKNANSVFKHETNTILEFAIRDSCAKWEITDCISRLDTKILEPSPLDTGWDVFILDYVFSPPLTTIFTDQAMEVYLRAFKFIFQLKRAQYLCDSYCSPRDFIIYQSYYELRLVFHKFQLFRYEISHFVNNFLSYLIVEVVEGSWKVFSKKMKNASGLDEVLQVHLDFLNDLRAKAFLDNEDMYKRVSGLVEIVVRFCAMFQDLIKEASEERFRREVEIRCGSIEELRVFDEMSCDVDLMKEQFLDEFLEFRKRLTGVNGFQRFLAFRLDFNEFYEIRE